ncbi:multiple monosaccharide ABC transporter substrate-binding protein [Lentzea flaviverrucosa]|uniref:Putative multiple sugar transport system substrate-binding protein n=1 Tax=Lentzea flaviverrucosa TaxID=200379 RepID=A0A1H9CG23_9PSEU|nr:multiple monosaccharide ABC transporter substrate-binding protein [Lentzea flaviverrucosa]RDI24535.1 monosaccharide ABC transporter substrate-binding protein (CUT2 family) [Lentzea flaviverrucosa]SEP99967.1 putative multiple sugar transport system substrate-binding protein [Lentzea flaviverrucosa]
MGFPRFAVLAVALLAAACGAPAAGQQPASGDGALVGVTMPTTKSERWISDGENIKRDLESRGHRVDLRYAENDVANQVKQIEDQIAKGAKLLIIASVDGSALTKPLDTAANAEIPVIAYDRLLRNSPNVDFYATFENFRVGIYQAESLLTGLGLRNPDGSPGAATGPFNIELFAGSADDNNSAFFFNGAMSVLRPYLDNGKLVVRSGQTDFQAVTTLRWDGETARKRMEEILGTTYRRAKVNGVLSPYDGISLGILTALKNSGYGPAFPTVTGQDAELGSVKSILAGEQYSTIYKDTRELAKVTALMAEAVLKGRTPPQLNNLNDYDNGVKVVPAFLLNPVSVDKANYHKVLVESGYYTDDQLR